MHNLIFLQQRDSERSSIIYTFSYSELARIASICSRERWERKITLIVIQNTILYRWQKPKSLWLSSIISTFIISSSSIKLSWQTIQSVCMPIKLKKVILTFRFNKYRPCGNSPNNAFTCLLNVITTKCLQMRDCFTF